LSHGEEEYLKDERIIIVVKIPTHKTHDIFFLWSEQKMKVL
jgi:hypothetical protein